MENGLAAAPANKASSKKGFQRRDLVRTTAAKLRDAILAQEPDTNIGSLNEVAQMLGVGIVTVQQAARILEHEGFLLVRRGPGGGYYGTRPDEAALERSVAAYLQVHGSGYREALEAVSLLLCEVAPAAAHSTDESLREALRALSQHVDECETPEQRVAFEGQLYDLLFKMVNWPLIELLCRVSTSLYKNHPGPALFPGEAGVAAWKTGRQQMLQAILRQDDGLARFEAERFRQQLVAGLRQNE